MHAPDAAAIVLAEFVIQLLSHMRQAGGLASFEGTRGHGLLRHGFAAHTALLRTATPQKQQRNLERDDYMRL